MIRLASAVQRAFERVTALARARAAGCRSGVVIGHGTRFGRGVVIRASSGGSIVIGSGVEVGAGTQLIASGGLLNIEDGSFLSMLCIVAARDKVTLGRDCMVAEMVSIRDHDHDPLSAPRDGMMLVEAVHIGPRVWIGSKSSVTRGAVVGADSVIGTLSVVRGIVPPSHLAAGAPIRLIRDLNEVHDPRQARE